MRRRSICSSIVALTCAILLTSGASAATAPAPATHGILLFAAPGSRQVVAGQRQKIWVHTMALATATLTVAYGNGQTVTLTAQTDAAGVHLFSWSPLYTGTGVTLARYWVHVSRGPRQTARRGDFVLYPAPPLAVRVRVLSPALQVGGTLRVQVQSRPGVALTLHLQGSDHRTLLVRSGIADRQGVWPVSAPVSATVATTQTLSLVVSGRDPLGRLASSSASLTLAPRPLSATALPLVAVRPSSLAAARREAQAAAAGSLVQAQADARQAVAALDGDLQVLAQWSTAPALHPIAYYRTLLAATQSYTAVIEVTAQALADDGAVQARLHAVMPHKAIMVSVADQTLRAYEDGQLVLFTEVTTGRPALPTVTGHFAIYAKVTPFQFISPWPQGSPYYYAPTWIKYWMPFYRGYGLHDAWWREHYGPGTNIGGDGPGSSEPVGTHGCVNIPFDKTQWLWNWAPVGTAVVVYGGPSVSAGQAGI